MRSVSVMVHPIHPGWQTLAGLPAGHLTCPACGVVAPAGRFRWVWAPGGSLAERQAVHGPDGGRWQVAASPPGSDRRDALVRRIVAVSGDATLAAFVYRVPLVRLTELDAAVTAALARAEQHVRENGREQWSQDYREEAIERVVARQLRGDLLRLSRREPTPLLSRSDRTRGAA